MITKYFEEVKRIADSIEWQKIEDIVDILCEAYYTKRTVYTMGCGGSASTATHFTADLLKGCGISSISLVDNIPAVSALTNDLGWEYVFSKQLETFGERSDVLVGFSVHGGREKWSGNLGKAMKYAKGNGIRIIGISGFDGGAMKEMADVCLIIPLDEEPYATPIVESFHSVIFHLICLLLKEKIKQSSLTETER